MKLYISNLRILATFTVIIIHTTANFVTKYNQIPLQTWLTANFVDALARFCVPIFVMISGALLLGKESSVKEFTTKRTKRILYPFLFWSLIYAFRKASQYFEFKSSVQKVLEDTFLLIFKGASYHFWYIFMIIGLYLLIPILSIWVRNATKRALQYFLIIWAVTLLYTAYFQPIDSIYFSKYIGYLVLGYYLDQHITAQKWASHWSVLMIICGTLSTCLLTAYFSDQQHNFVATFYDYTSLNVALTATGLFMLFKTLANSTHNYLKVLDQNSFGVYFVHVLVLEKIRGFIPIQHYYSSPSKAILYILLVAFSCYAISLASIYLLRQIRPLSKWIG